MFSSASLRRGRVTPNPPGLLPRTRSNIIHVYTDRMKQSIKKKKKTLQHQSKFCPSRDAWMRFKSELNLKFEIEWGTIDR